MKNEIPILGIYIHNSATVNQLFFNYYRSQTSIKTKDDVIYRF